MCILMKVVVAFFSLLLILGYTDDKLEIINLPDGSIIKREQEILEKK